jgi:hypothetical protein
MLCMPMAALPARFLDRLAARGIRVGTIDPETIRFCTHKDIDDHDVDWVVSVLDEIAKE